MANLNEKEKLLSVLIFVFVLLFPSNYILFTQSVFFSEKIFIFIWTSFILGFCIYAWFDKDEQLEKLKINKK